MSAKSRIKDKPAFEFPEFDKEEYIAKEFRDAKVTGVVILFALIIALVSYFIVRIDTGYRIVGLLLIILAELGLKDYFSLMKIDTSTFEKKNWAGNVLLLFFAWFGMFTLLLNPPFIDMVDPHVDSIVLYTIENETSENVTYLQDPNPTINTTISINATVVDNSKLESVVLYITLPDKNTTMRSMKKTGNKDNEYTGGTIYLDQKGTYEFRVLAEDDSGNKDEKTLIIVVGA